MAKRNAIVEALRIARKRYADGGTPEQIDPITGLPIVKKPVDAGVDPNLIGGGGSSGPAFGGTTPSVAAPSGTAMSSTSTSPVGAPSSTPTSLTATENASALSPAMAAALA